MKQIMLGNLTSEFLSSKGFLEDAKDKLNEEFQSIGAVFEARKKEPKLIEPWLSNWCSAHDLKMDALIKVDTAVRKPRNTHVHKIDIDLTAEAILGEPEGEVRTTLSIMFKSLFPQENLDSLLDSPL